MSTPTRDGTHNLGMCPEQELNPNILVYGAMLQPTKPHYWGSIECETVKTKLLWDLG